VATPTPAVTQATPAGEPISEQDSIAASLASGNIILTLLTFFGLGLLLAFTPCVFPMIPILSGIIIGQGEKITTGKAFSLSLAYVLAMAATYTVAGVLAGLFGANIQVWFQNPWVLGVFAGIFVLLSLSMFGFYELQMPNAIQSRLTEVSNKQKGGSLVGAAIMGLLSALIVGPCVTAPLVGALIYIGQTGDAVLGGAALFFLSLGMGAPLLVIGTSAGKLLPRAGAWMDATKAVFGVLLLGVAIWLIERVIPEAVTLVLAAALLIISAIYMGALEPIREAASGWMRLWKGIGIIMLIWGAIMLFGAASGGSDLLQPLKGIHGSSAAMTTEQAQNELHFRKVKSLADLEQAVDEARGNGQPVMFDFYADWCVSCKEMEKYTFTDPGVQKALEGVMLLQADVTANDAQDKELLANFGIIGPPAILFFDKKGVEKRNYRVVGYKPAEEFAAHIRGMRGL
jgi:thiol:disulfide interchange protein DsbD